MLTSDLMRVKVSGDLLIPRYVHLQNSDVRRETKGLLALHDDYVGRAMGELESGLADYIGDSPRFLVQRGLSKLLLDKATVEVVAGRPPEEVRAVVHEVAEAEGPVAPGHATREAILEEAGRRLGLTVSEVETSLYADLKRAERLVALPIPEVTTLLHRYNMALAQGVLLRASRVRIQLPELAAKEARYLFRALKFRRLMHRMTRTKRGYRLELDGPLSLFKMTTRYGLGLALFLPTLCRFSGWSLEADVVWGKERKERRFELDASVGLKSEAKVTGLWEGKEETHFRATFRAFKSDWALRRNQKIFTLPTNEALIPDYTLTHPDGRVVYLDLMWTWRARDLDRKLRQRLDEGPPNLLVALATKLQADRETVSSFDPRVVPFKGVISPKHILAACERLRPPA